MGAWLQGHIHGRLRQKPLVAYRGYSVDLGMSFAVFPVVAFAYDFIVVHYDRAHHRVGRDVS